MRKTNALSEFNRGCNCCQAVLKSFAKDLEVDSGICEGMAAGFGAGMGGMQKTCGAITGAYMAMGMMSQNSLDDIDSVKGGAKNKILAFNKAFLGKYNSLDCRELLGLDMNSDAGKKELEEKKLRQTVCEKVISLSVEIVEDIEKL